MKTMIMVDGKQGSSARHTRKPLGCDSGFVKDLGVSSRMSSLAFRFSVSILALVELFSDPSQYCSSSQNEFRLFIKVPAVRRHAIYGENRLSMNI